MEFRLLLLLPGVFLLCVGLIAIIYPPKRVNWWYGYRTPRSMRSQEAWEDSNRLAARLIVAVGVLSLNTGVTCGFFSRHIEVALAIVGMVTGTLSLGIFVAVEVFLSKMFDKNGKPRDRA